jgi:hypothetical protein
VIYLLVLSCSEATEIISCLEERRTRKPVV